MTGPIGMATPTVEELEAENEKLQERIAELEGALKSIAANTCCEYCQEARLVAEQALKEKDSG